MRDIEDEPAFESKALPVALGLLVNFAALAKGAHDIWAATVVYSAAVVLFIVCTFRWSWNRQSAGVRFFGMTPLLILLGVFATSHYFSIRPEESYLEFMDWTSASLLFIIALNIFHRPRAVVLFILTVAPLFAVEAAIAVFQKAGFGPGVYREEPPGSFLNANFAAAFYLLWAPVLGRMIMSNRDGVKKIPWLWILCGLSLAIALVLTSSVFAWLCLLLAFPVIVWGQGLPALIKRHARLSGLVAFIILSVVAAFVWFKYSQIYRWDYEGPFAPPTSRLTWWWSALSMWKDHVWLGTGPGTFGSAYLAYKIGVGQNTIYAHSNVLSLLAETGLLGVASFGFFLWRFGSKAASRISLDSESGAFLVGIVLFMLFGLINVSYELFSNLMMVFIGLGILLSAKTGSPVKFRRSVLILIAAGGVSAMVFISTPFVASQNIVAGNRDLSAGRIDAAYEAFKAASELSPSFSEPYRGMAKVRAKENRFDEAVGYQEQAIARNRLAGVPWWELGRFLESNNKPLPALRAYEQALRLHRTNTLFQADADRLKSKL